MSKYDDAEKKVAKKHEVIPLYSEDDYKRFLEAMKDFTGNKRVGGHLYSAFEQYAESLGVIAFQENGGFVVRDPAGYTRLSKMNARYELRLYHKDEDFMQQNPEARTDFQKRIAKIRENLTDKMRM